MPGALIVELLFLLQLVYCSSTKANLDSVRPRVSRALLVAIALVVLLVVAAVCVLYLTRPNIFSLSSDSPNDHEAVANPKRFGSEGDGKMHSAAIWTLAGTVSLFLLIVAGVSYSQYVDHIRREEAAHELFKKEMREYLDTTIDSIDESMRFSSTEYSNDLYE